MGICSDGSCPPQDLFEYIRLPPIVRQKTFNTGVRTEDVHLLSFQSGGLPFFLG